MIKFCRVGIGSDKEDGNEADSSLGHDIETKYFFTSTFNSPTLKNSVF